MNSAFEKWLQGWVYGLIKNIDIKESVGVKRQQESMGVEIMKWKTEHIKQRKTTSVLLSSDFGGKNHKGKCQEK